MGWSRASGVEIHFQCSGAGERGLILVHELGGTLESWDAVVPWLEPHFRVLRYDQRGSGLSERVRDAFAIEDQVRDLEALIEKAGLKPPYNLAGTAAGAGVVLLFAQWRPEQVSSLVLCSPSVGIDTERKQYFMERSEIAVREGMGAIADATLARSFPDEVIRDRAVYDAYRARYLDNDPVSYRLANRALARANVEAAVESVKCPCLVVAGEYDVLRTPERVRAFSRRLQNAEFTVLDGGHILPLQAPEALAERMLEFLLPCAPARQPLLDPSPADSISRVKVNGIHFHCRVDGKPGAPWILFSNSLMTDLSLWDRQVAALEDSFRILRYDQRGHGKTEVPSSPCTFDLLADDAAALLDAFAIERAAVIGVSMGAVTVLRLASCHPERVSRVVACDGQWAASAAGAAAWETRIQIAEEMGISALVEPTMERWFRPQSIKMNPRELVQVREMIRETPVKGFVYGARALQEYDFRSDFSRIRLPVMLLAGAMDGSLPQVMQEMHRAVAGSRFVQIDDAGHLPNVERAEKFNEAIAAFLREPLVVSS